MYVIAAVIKPRFRIGASNPVDGSVQGFFERLAGPRLGLAQLGFELAPGLLDGGKVGRIRGQKQDFYPTPGQPLPQPGQVVHPQAVEDQHVPAP